MLSRRLLSILALCWGAHSSAQAGEPNRAEPNRVGDEYEKTLRRDIALCGTICLDEADILLFGGTITVPAERPSVEQCGVWMSAKASERAEELEGRRQQADKEARQKQFSPREREELKKRATEPIKRCESDFRRRCDEARKNVAIGERKNAVERTSKAVEEIVDERRRAAVKKYLANLLEQCPLAE
jgi:hypothetical protein